MIPQTAECLAILAKKVWHDIVNGLHIQRKFNIKGRLIWASAEKE